MTTTCAPKVRSVVGTQTEKNLVKAYLGESQAYSRYIFYAKQAAKDEYFPVEYVFLSAAANELHHAKVYFKLLPSDSMTSVSVATHAGLMGDTVKNLQISIDEEKDEEVNYLAYAAVARDEGFQAIATTFEAIASVEATHAARFETFLNYILTDSLWKRESAVTWQCLVCGFCSVGKTPPDRCKGCDHPSTHFMAITDMDGLIADSD